MSSAVHRTARSVTGAVALAVALLALLAAAAGVGYAAATIGTDDIADNAITGAKIKKKAVTGAKIKKNAVDSTRIKDGSLRPEDLAPHERQRKPRLGNGGEDDCRWLPGPSQVAGSAAPTYRKDRNGRVVLSGLAFPVDGPGGDTDCDPEVLGQAADGIVFTLPAGYVPAQTQYVYSPSGPLIITGPQGYLGATLTLPAGVVYSTGPAVLDTVEFDPAGSAVSIARVGTSGRWSGDPL